ncbi:polysaccharide biosynthesis protein [Chroogloeocystis siderophila 5.2 s.c.1]|uniref:Polysaccharide biosynthesis protein n=2 Tax=Chroogloeocystis TaxID=329162 RepID=A0A1U7HGH2_9CHRO|nr:polysaccharide biosynthesis protein [Chroogloeocystis siderophila 5.2 s.c.1]
MRMLQFSPKAIYWCKTLSKFVSVQLIIQGLGFISGLLIVRTLDKQQYAYFTIANTMQGSMTVLSDSGITAGLSAIGGRVWQNRDQFSQLINTALQLRIYLSIISVVAVTPITLWLLISNGASILSAILIVIVIILGLNAQLTIGVLEIVPRLYSQINRIQTIELVPSVSRLVLLLCAYFTSLNALIAVFISSLSLLLKRSVLIKWVTQNIDSEAKTNQDYYHEILAVIKSLSPNTIFYCIQGQITVWLISFFGNTQNIAEVGALSRLAVIFSIINSVIAGIISPSFARCHSVTLLHRKYWQIVGISCFLGFCILVFIAIFPVQILWLLGEQYAHLQNELFLIALSTIFSHVVGVMWSLNCSKAWVSYSWFSIPSTLTTQIALLFLINLSTIEGVIMFGILSNIPSLALNIVLMYKGLASYKALDFE